MAKKLFFLQIVPSAWHIGHGNALKVKCLPHKKTNKQTNKHKTPTFKVSDLYVHYYFIIAVSDLFQPISLGMHRSDYMLNCSVPTNEIIASRQKVDLEGIQLRQIEFNTMASSFGGLAQKVEECHRYINQYRIIIIWGACLISPLCLNNMSGESDSSTCYLWQDECGMDLNYLI